MKPYLLLAVSVALALDAAAQQSSIPQPGDPAARVPVVTYQSAFDGYTPWREPKIAPWRELNDEVGRVGGHGGILGAAGHAGHGAQGKPPSDPSQNQLRPEGESKEPPAGQPPVRSAPKAPAHSHGGH